MANCINCGNYTGEKGSSLCTHCKIALSIAGIGAIGEIIDSSNDAFDRMIEESPAWMVPIIFLTISSVIIFGCIFIYDLRNCPYNPYYYIANYYYGALYYIIKITKFVFIYFKETGITSFPNLNLLLGILFGLISFIMTLFSPAVCFYCFFIVIEIVSIDEKKEFGYKQFFNYDFLVTSLWIFLIIFILPFIFGLIWFFINVILKIFTAFFIWLFSR